MQISRGFSKVATRSFWRAESCLEELGKLSRPGVLGFQGFRVLRKVQGFRV